MLRCEKATGAALCIVSAVREDDAIHLLRAAFQGPERDVLVGIGDDAAVLASSGPLVVSVDAAIEEVHFRRSFLSLEAVGARSFRAAVSDLAAMGAEPQGALLSLALPVADEATLIPLSQGLAHAARETGCPIVGGNLTRARELGLHTTVMGRLVGPALLRSGARPGDGLWVSGTLGAAALGFAALERGASSELLAPFVQRWREARARLDVGRAIRGVASACLDVSDGLLRDAERLAKASGVALAIDVDALPLEPQHQAAAASLGCDGIDLALSGGEDYELLFTAPLGFRSALATHIGQVREGAGVTASRGGRPLASRGVGHDHFE